MDTSLLFNNPPTTFIDVFDVAFKLIGEHWKTIGRITIFQFFAILATVIVLFLITFAFTATYLAAIHEHIKTMGGSSSGYRRALFDTSVGMSGVSRFLANGYNSYNPDYDDHVPDYPKDQNVYYIVIILYGLWIIGLSLVNSVFVGTYNHALASIYGGVVPNVRQAFSHGMEKMCSLFNYHILFSLAITGIVLFIPLVFSGVMSSPLKVVFLMLGLLAAFVFSSFLAGATPSIVVEKKSATQAFGRSWKLCKSHVGFIMCTRLMFYLFSFIVTLILNFIFDEMPGVLSFLGHLLVSSLVHAIGPV